MIALFGSIFGLLSGFIPEIIKLFKSRQDNAHELAVMDKQLENTKLLGAIRLEEVGIEADARETEALYKASEQKITGVGWIDGLVSLYNSSVRPTITYAFFVMYSLVKYGQYIAIKGSIATPQNTTTILAMIWTSEDMAIFCTIISYWFGSRAMKYFMGKR